MTARARRGLALIVGGTLVLAVAIGAYLRPAPPGPSAPHQPDLASSMDWVSGREGWLSALDHLAGTSTLFHTADAGGHWARLRVSAPVDAVAFFDARHGLLSSAGTYRTADGGRHWQRLTLPAGAEAQEPVFAGASDGWVWDPADPGLYGTSDGGSHWRRLDADGLPLSPAPRIAGFRDSRHGWMAATDATDAPALYATSDGGETWSAVDLPAPTGGWALGDQFRVGPVAIAADGHGQLMVTELVRWEFRQLEVAHWVAATADAGATWSVPHPMPPTHPGTVVSLTTSRTDGAVSLAWSADSLLATRDAGAHWTPVTLPAAWSVDRVRAVDARMAWAAVNVTDAHGDSRWRLFSTEDAGVTWTEAKIPKLG